MSAVMEDAAFCFQKYVSARDRRGIATFCDAQEWIMEEGGDWLFSFENICEALGFNPQYIRVKLLHWKEKQLARHRRIRPAVSRSKRVQQNCRTHRSRSQRKLCVITEQLSESLR